MLDDLQYPDLGEILLPPKHSALAGQSWQLVGDTGASSRYVPSEHSMHCPSLVNS